MSSHQALSTLDGLGPTLPPGIRFGVAIRPPRYRWDGSRFISDRLLGIDYSNVANLPGRVEIVNQNNFVGVVADSLTDAQEAARKIKTDWEPVSQSDDRNGPRRAVTAASATGKISQHRACEDTTSHIHDYGWPSRMSWGDAPGWVVVDLSAQRLRLWGQTATPVALTYDLALLTGLTASQIELYASTPSRMIALGRHCGDDAAVDAALMSLSLGYPVAVWLDASYARDMHALGQAQRITLSANVEESGKIGRFRYRQAHATGEISAVGLWLCGKLDAPLAKKAFSAETFPFSPYVFQDAQLATRTEDASAKRENSSLADIQHTFARESFLDEVAHDTGQDPVALRLRHLDDKRGIELIKSVSHRAQWRSGSSTNVPECSDLLFGRGFAYSQLPAEHLGVEAGVRSAWIADVEVNRVTGGVRLTRLVIGQDAGPDVDTACLQQTLQTRVLGEASPLLTSEPAFDEWDNGSSGDASPAFGALVARGEAPSHVTTPRDDGGADALPALLDDADLSPGVAVIGNALFDATGVRFRQPPFTAGRVRQALKEQESKRSAGRAGITKRSGWNWLTAAAVTAIAGTAAVAWPWKSAISPVPRPSPTLYSAETIERGRLVAAAGDCAACHTTEGGMENAGGRPFETPFGTIYSTNLTPDEKTGIGHWSYAAFERAMRHGISRDGRHLYPAFPYTAFAKISDADMQALYAYLMAQPSVSAQAPANSMTFPFNMRQLMAGWNTLYLDPKPFEPDPTQTDLYNRGAYLAEGLGHCSACHSPRNAMGAEQRGARYLAGAMVDGWEAPPLNNLSRAPIPWSEASLYDYLRNGGSPLHGVASGPMAPVVAGLEKLPEYDVRAIAHYVAMQMGAPVGDSDAAKREAELRITKAQVSPSGMEAGERLFEGACAACHVNSLPSFSTARTSLALNTNLHSEQPDNLIQSILGGVHAEHVPGVGNMPGFGDSFSDSQTATLAAYLRARFAPDKAPWENLESRVSAVRQDNNNTSSFYP